MSVDPTLPPVLVLAAIALVLFRRPVARVAVWTDALFGLRTTERHHEWISIAVGVAFGALGAWAAFAR